MHAHPTPETGELTVRHGDAAAVALLGSTGAGRSAAVGAALVLAGSAAGSTAGSTAEGPALVRRRPAHAGAG